METTKSPASVIVIGAGAGGIAAAARLALEGFQVKVVEKNNFVGGRCSLLHKDGYRYDQGPSLVLMPEFFRQAFQELGTSLENEGIHMLECEPNYCIWFPDHDHIELSRDIPRLKAQIEFHEGPRGFSRFCTFLAESGLQYELCFLYIRPWTSMYSQAAKYFRSEKMRRVWSFESMYLGISPYRALGAFSLLPYIEMTDGIWYPRGGFQRVLHALSRVGRRLGVEYLLDSPVAKIELSDDNAKATGVRLESGEVLRADIVVVNADLVYAYNHLLPPSPKAERLRKRSTSCSSISFYWAFNEQIPELRPHNVFLAGQFRESFDRIFNDHDVPEDFSFYVNVPSRVDVTAAPAGKESVMVLVPVGRLVDTLGPDEQEKRWNELVAQTRNIVLDTIEARTGARNLREKLVHELVNSPLTWREKFNLDRGAILGLSHDFDNVLWFRPHMKHPAIQSLYFTGCSTHPGAGVPACLLSGKFVVQQIMEDWMEAKATTRDYRLWVMLAMAFGLLTALSLAKSSYLS
ncbi:phytoene dehydrogenase [Aspergillus niger]|uniref:Phytoene desaturase n=1 Tax=Aspergillus niger TaxID=5061 RepID=A0A100IP98_ASPNG|nr:phytoene dehydrogenase [Aspergillus niger]